MARVFLSHAYGDLHLVLRLAEALRRGGHAPLLLEQEVRPGGSIIKATEQCLQQADAILLCLSQAALEGAWTQREFEHALQWARSHNLPVLLVRFERVRPSAPLPEVMSVDLFVGNRGWDEGVARLLEALDHLGAQERPVPGNLPAAPAGFVGRHEEVRHLLEVLEPQSAGGRQASIIGPGGMGKSALALQFAHQEAGRFPGGTWWVPAGYTAVEGLALLSHELRRLAPLTVRSAFDHVPPQAPSAELASAARQALERSELPSLLIIDEADDPDWIHHLPCGRVSTLVTTRGSQPVIGKSLHLEPLLPAEALQLTKELLLVLESPHAYEHEARAHVVSELTAGIPLALRLVTAMAEQTQWGRLEQQLRSVSQPPLAGVTGVRPGESLRAAIDKAVSHLGTLESRVLEAHAILAPAPAPPTWVSTIVGVDTESPELRDALTKLEAESRLLPLHPAVKQRLLEQMEPGTHATLLLRAIDALESSLYSRLELPDIEPLDQLKKYQPHITELLQTTQQQGPPEAWVRLALAAAWLKRLQSDPSAALALLEQAVDRARALTDRRHLLSSLASLADLLRAMGHKQRAAAHAQEALQLLDTLPQQSDASSIISLDMLARVLREQDRGLARSLAQQALQRAEVYFGADDKRTALILSHLALIVLDTEEPAAASPLYQRALQITEQRTGLESPLVAKIASAWADVLRRLGDISGARVLLERAVAIDQRLLPPDELVVAGRLGRLASVLMEAGDFAQARLLLERATRIEEARLGPDHPALATSLHNLGSTLLWLGQAKEAKALLARALELKQRALPPGDPSISKTRMGLAAAAEALGDHQAAARYLERALDTGLSLYSPVPGPGYDSLEKALRHARGQPAGAEASICALSEALTLSMQRGDIPNAARAALLLGSHEGRRGGWESARRFVEQGLRLSRQAQLPALTAEGYKLLGDASLHGSRYEDARMSYHEAIRRYEELGFTVKAARARALLMGMQLQLGRAEGVDAHAAMLRGALDEDIFTDAEERADMEHLLKLGDTFLREVSRAYPGSAE